MKIITDDNQEISFDSIKTIELNENEKLIIQVPDNMMLTHEKLNALGRMQHELDIQLQSKCKVIITSSNLILTKIKK